MKKRYLITIYLFLLIFIFIHLVPKTMSGIKIIYFNFVLKKNIANKPTLKKQFWGIYKPELPFDFSSINFVENYTNKNFSIISYYQSWGNTKNEQFPLEIFKNLNNKYLMITWEPWLTKFENSNIIINNSFKRILRRKYDNYIINYAKDCIKYGKPILIRFAHEPTNPMYEWSSEYGNDSIIYKQTWQYVYQIFKNIGAKNVAFVWTPYSQKDTSFYPGDDYVDYIAFDVFNYGTVMNDGKWHTFENIVKPLIDSYKKFNKPMFVAEMGSVNFGGNKQDWYRDSFKYMKNSDDIIGAVFYDFPNWVLSKTTTIDWSISQDTTILNYLKRY